MRTPPCRTSRAHRVLARGRAAERPDGRPLPPPGQPGGRQLGVGGGARAHRDRSDAAVRRAAPSSPWAARALPATVDGRGDPGVDARRRSRPAPSCRSAPSDGPGLRGCLAVRGGIDVPLYLGSRSTFTLGGFGGLEGRAARSPATSSPVGDDVDRPAPSAAAGSRHRRWHTTGSSACSSVRTPRPSSSPPRASPSCSARRGGCTSTPPGPASG